MEGDAALERDPIRGEAVLGEARSGLPFELAEDRADLRGIDRREQRLSCLGEVIGDFGIEQSIG